jgi:hypothetical protein
MEFAIDVTNLVARLPRWTEKRDDFPSGVFELDKKVGTL